MAVIIAPVVNPALITNAANTNDNTVNLDALFPPKVEIAKGYISKISANLQFNTLGAVTSGSATYGTTDSPIVDLKKGNPLHIKGAAGGETFAISVVTEARFQGLGAE